MKDEYHSFMTEQRAMERAKAFQTVAIGLTVAGCVAVGFFIGVVFANL
jgi:hypothetical protein